MYTGPNITTDGLVLALDAANTKSYVSESTVWNDLSGNRNSGSLVNGPTFSSANGGSIRFDGVDDYVLIPSTLIRNLLSTDCTIIVVCSYSTFVGLTFPTLIGSMTFGSQWKGWRLVFSASNRTLTFSNASGVNGTNQSSISFNYTFPNNINQFTYLACTWIASTGAKKTFINGELTNSVSSSTYGFIQNPQTVRIGGQADGPNDNNFCGRVALTQIYNRALSAEEVLQNYNATKTRFGL